jgi:hypothetical protein
MAISSLSRLSVPLKGGAGDRNQSLLMPKLGYRFRVLFFNFGINPNTTELTKQIMDATRPSPDFAEVTLDVYNSKIKLAGKASWSDVTIKIRDDASNTVSKLVGQQLQKQMDFFEQASAAAGQDYKFVTRIEILDGGNGAFEPVVLEGFDMYGCFIQKADYKAVNYTESTPLDIGLTIRYDNALQDQGIGDFVGRTRSALSTGVR